MVMDVVGALFLWSAGVLGVRTWRLRGDVPGASYWLFAGMGMVYLGFDELLNVHETLGRNLWEAGVPNPPGFNHLDDFLVLLYACAGLAVTIGYLPELRRSGRAVIMPFGLALGLLGVSIVIDATAPVEGIAPYFEETSELLGTMLFALAFYRRYQQARIPAELQAAAILRPAAADRE